MLMGLNTSEHEWEVSALHAAHTCTGTTQLCQATELQRMCLCMRVQRLKKMSFAGSISFPMFISFTVTLHQTVCKRSTQSSNAENNDVDARLQGHACDL